MTAASDMVRWAWSLAPDEMPQAVRDRVSQLITDAVGCALGAAQAGVPGGTGIMEAFGAGDEATVLGTGQRVPAVTAAFANAALIRALAWDDHHHEAGVNPSAAVLAPALAVAEQQGASGADLLTACAAGYEVAIRLGVTAGDGLTKNGFDPTPVCGMFGGFSGP